MRDRMEREYKKPLLHSWIKKGISSVQFSSVQLLSRGQGVQHTRLPCPLPTHGVYSKSCPWSRWCHPTISSFVIPFNPSQLQGLFQWVSFLHQNWSLSFSISPSDEYSGLISFRMGLVGSSCSPRDSQESSPTPYFKTINSSVLSFLYSPTFTSIHDPWKNYSLD